MLVIGSWFPYWIFVFPPIWMQLRIWFHNKQLRMDRCKKYTGIFRGLEQEGIVYNLNMTCDINDFLFVLALVLNLVYTYINIVLHAFNHHYRLASLSFMSTQRKFCKYTWDSFSVAETYFCSSLRHVLQHIYSPFHILIVEVYNGTHT